MTLFFSVIMNFVIDNHQDSLRLWGRIVADFCAIVVRGSGTIMTKHTVNYIVTAHHRYCSSLNTLLNMLKLVLSNSIF